MNAIKHIAAEGERWDQLSWRYFADPMGYERILAANPGMPFYASLPGGAVIAVPVVEASNTMNPKELPPWKKP